MCNGDTGHAEAVEIRYDPDQLSFNKVLDVFFTIHDPTQLNRQASPCTQRVSVHQRQKLLGRAV